MLSKKKASVDHSKDMDGPKSPDDTFQVSASLGIFHTDIRSEEEGPNFLRYIVEGLS